MGAGPTARGGRSSDLVGLVEDHPDLVVLSLEGSDGLGELVRDVQFVGVEEQDDPVHPLAEPAQNLGKVVTCAQKNAERFASDVLPETQTLETATQKLAVPR